MGPIDVKVTGLQESMRDDDDLIKNAHSRRGEIEDQARAGAEKLRVAKEFMKRDQNDVAKMKQESREIEAQTRELNSDIRELNAKAEEEQRKLESNTM